MNESNSEFEQLIDLIHMLEARIVELEMQLHKRKRFNHSDQWYWEHG